MTTRPVFGDYIEPAIYDEVEGFTVLWQIRPVVDDYVGSAVNDGVKSAVVVGYYEFPWSSVDALNPQFATWWNALKSVTMNSPSFWRIITTGFFSESR